MIEKTTKIKNFRDLQIWQLAKTIVVETYKTTSSLPKAEIFGITSQMRRSTLSIPSNIAEGFNRFHNSEYRQFLYIALGSCGELETQIEISSDLGYITPKRKTDLFEMLNHESRMIRNLIKKL